MEQMAKRGRQCVFPHPKQCQKFCNFGWDKFQGCDGSCNLFHPTICRNSLNYRECNDESCTFNLGICKARVMKGQTPSITKLAQETSTRDQQ